MNCRQVTRAMSALAVVTSGDYAQLSRFHAAFPEDERPPEHGARARRQVEEPHLVAARTPAGARGTAEDARAADGVDETAVGRDGARQHLAPASVVSAWTGHGGSK